MAQSNTDNGTIDAFLTADVEDWLYLCSQNMGVSKRRDLAALERQMNRLLALLSHHQCRGTFFCSGASLEVAPHIVRLIAEEGHEIASHGWHHRLIHVIGLDAFERDLDRSIKWLADITGRRIRGYRAPAFSVTAEQLPRFFDICFEAGLDYDSSVFPFKGSRYGLPDMPQTLHVVRECGDRFLIEVPLATIDRLGRRWPIAGGGWWRLLPGPFIRAGLRAYREMGSPAMTYVHPYEFDKVPLDVRAAEHPPRFASYWNLRQNLGRKRSFERLNKTLSIFRFGAVEDYLDQNFTTGNSGWRKAS